MFTLSLLTSRSVQVFLETSDVSKVASEIVNSRRRDVIKKGLSGLFAVATATTAIGVLAGELDQNVGQVVNTVHGPLSFAQIQKHPQRAEILKKLPEEIYDAFDEWIEKGKKVAIDEGRKIDTNTQVAIDELSQNAKALEKTVRATLDAKLKIPAQYRHTMETIITFGKPPETVRYFQEVLRNPSNFV